MELKEILSKCDHTLLLQPSTWAEIQAICDDGMKYGCASVCIPSGYVKQAAEYVEGKLPICTVIGFPNGYNSTAVKVFETEEAVKDGADEIDMVINIGDLKAKKYDAILTPACSKAELEAYDISQAFGKVFAQSVFTATANLIGAPALVSGGVQLLGKHFSDSDLLSLAGAVERMGE